jgi:conjugative relaxase-like TrwC/TraI family protein
MAVLKSTRLRLKTSGSVDAVREYLRTTREYYAQDEVKAGGKTILPDAEWLDSPATDRLGLNAPERDQDDDFAKLLAGYHPRTGEALVQNAGEAGRCMGVDLTFSPRKEYSLAFIAAGPKDREKMTQAFHLARDKALGLVSKGVNTRAGKGGKRHVGIDGLVIRAVDHIDSRSGEPQWHCHAVVANVALDQDGKWRSVDFRGLMRQTGSLQEAAQEVFARELAEGFQRLGFGIERERILDEDERDTGKVANKIAGIDQATCEAFSSRRKEILDAIKQAEAKGKTLTGGEAAMKTRQAKHMSASEVIVEARTRLEELAALTPGHFVRASDLLGQESAELERQKEAATWFDELHAMNSHWNRSGLIAKLARELPLGSGVDIPEEADRLLAEWEATGTIIRLKDDPDLQQTRWCSRDQWFLEVGVLPAARKRADEQGLRLNRTAAAVAIALHEAAMSKKFGKEVQLTDEQKASVLHVLCDTGGLACIIGQAGTGKSASAGAYIRAFEAAGRRVIGTSTSQAATDNLKKEAGIEGMNTAELLHALDSGKLTLAATDVIVLDEAGMVGAKTFRRIQKHVDAVGAKLVAVGDPKQLEAIEAGGPFAELCEQFGAAAITQIQRQRNQEERDLAESFYNDKKTGEDIVNEMRAKGMLIEDKHQIKALAKLYLADERGLQDKLIVVSTHADGASVDHYVRRGLKEQGVIREQAREVLTLGSGEYQRELEVCLGERIRFQKNDRKDKDGKRKWNNNDIGTVVGMRAARGKRGVVLKIKMDEDGRTVEVDTAAFQRFGYAYARTAHSAQGLGAESTYWLARGGSIDRNMGLVAMTRTKDNFHAFASPEEAKRLEQALDEWGKKETVKELARRKNAPLVAQDLGKPVPTALGEVEHPTETRVREIKVRQTQEALDHAEVIARAGRAVSQAMDRWKELQREELGWVEMELDLLAQPGGDIERYEGLSASADTQMRKAFEATYRQAKNEQEELLERKAVLTRASEDAKKQAAIEMSAWFEKDYVGGVAAARRDMSLSKATPWVASFRQRAFGLRRQVLKRQRSLEQQLAQARSRPDPQDAQAMETAVLERARKVRALHSLVDKGQFVGDKRKQRKVVLGVDITTPIEDTDFNTSRFPPRDKQTHVDPEAMASPTGRNPTPAPRKRSGMLPTQPRLPDTPKPPGWDQEIGM